MKNKFESTIVDPKKAKQRTMRIQRENDATDSSLDRIILAPQERGCPMILSRTASHPLADFMALGDSSSRKVREPSSSELETGTTEFIIDRTSLERRVYPSIDAPMRIASSWARMTDPATKKGPGFSNNTSHPKDTTLSAAAFSGITTLFKPAAPSATDSTGLTTPSKKAPSL